MSGLSSTIISIKPFHLTFQYGRPYRRHLHLPSLQASMAPSKDDPGATSLRKDCESGGRSSTVSWLLKAVQEGGSNAVMQQVSSIRHFFMPELPYALITEIKKRMPLSFRDEEEVHHSYDLSGGLIKEKELEEQLMMGPRCAWPRLKLASVVDEERREDAQTMQGPRCAWPRGAQAPQSVLQQSCKQEEVGSNQSGFQARGGSSMSSQEGNILNSARGMESSRSGDAAAGKSRSQDEALTSTDARVMEGPRCAWPRSTSPRRMLATGVGLGLMNYLFIGQGASALAIVLQSPPLSWEEKFTSPGPLEIHLLP